MILHINKTSGNLPETVRCGGSLVDMVERKEFKRGKTFEVIRYTPYLPIAKIIGAKNVRAWVSMVSHLKE